MDQYSIIGPPADKERRIVPEENSAPPAEAASEAGSASPGSEFSRLQPSSESATEAGLNELDAALQTLVQKAQYICNASGAALALRQGANMVCRAASGNSAPDRGVRLQIKTGLTAECLRSGELLRCDNVHQDTRVDLESCQRLGIESIIITPVRQGKSLVGVLELFAAHAYCFQERDVETVRALAQEIGKMLEPGQGEAALPAPEPPVLEPAETEQSTCSQCGSQIESDAVFCTACGSFQESKPASAPEQPVGWRSRLNGRRLLVPALFVVMAVVVALAPIPRQPAGVAPAPRTAVQAGARPAATAPVTRAARSNGASTALVGTNPAQGDATKPASNPTIANSVKELLGGVSSDFSKLLPVNEKAEPPSNGDPNRRVWVDTRKGYYYCPGDDQYGHTEKGSFMTQRQAEANYYIPAMIKPCT